jgi:hypothetical protein
MKLIFPALGLLLLTCGLALAQNNAAGGSNQANTTPVGTIEPSVADTNRHQATRPAGTVGGNAEATAAAHRDLDGDRNAKQPNR